MAKHQQYSFASIQGVHPKTASTLERNGLTHAFPVQSAVIPAGIKGSDFLVQSPTGSGKTLAFGIPILEQIKTATKVPTALVLVPTRELAIQVSEDLQLIATGKQLQCVPVYGGASIHTQSRQVRNAAIIVATPGRLFDFIRSRKIDLRAVKILVLDEADRMLDMGFQPQVDEIVATMPPRRQTMLFSATLEGPVAKIAAAYTRDAKIVQTDKVPGAGGKIDHIMMETSTSTKVDTVLDALSGERDLAVVFVRTQMGADRLNLRLREYGHRSTAIHGGMSQGQREREYGRFQKGKCDVLVATDVFARGMDLDRITHVINYDLPEDADTYRHRTGRTGRAGRTGTAITMVMPKQRKLMKKLMQGAGVPTSAVDQMIKPSGKRWKPVPASERYVEKPQPGPKEPRGKHERGTRRDRGTHRSQHSKPNVRTPSAGHVGKPGRGTVVSYDPQKGFGFINPDSGGADVFFHRKAMSGCSAVDMQRGTRVAFTASAHERGDRTDEVRIEPGEHRSGGNRHQHPAGPGPRRGSGPRGKAKKLPHRR